MADDPLTTADSDRLPFAPSLATAGLAGLGGLVPDVPDAFRVDEISLYEPSGEGPHVYVRVEKTGWNTRDAVKRIARAANVSPRDVGVAGQKDRRAVTTQWISIPERSVPHEEWTLPEGIRVIAASRHRNKLRTGHLTGNRFSIRIEEIDTVDEAIAEAIASTLRTEGVPNYFGPQRFGMNGRNLGDALDWLSGSSRKRPGIAS